MLPLGTMFGTLMKKNSNEIKDDYSAIVQMQTKRLQEWEALSEEDKKNAIENFKNQSSSFIAFTYIFQYSQAALILLPWLFILSLALIIGTKIISAIFF